MKINHVMTRGISEFIKNDVQASKEVLRACMRFSQRDWGEMYDEDKQLNDNALATGEGRLFAAYDLNDANKSKIWIIQDDVAGVDETTMTILFPEEY